MAQTAKTRAAKIVPIPLPPHARALRNHRYEVDVAERRADGRLIVRSTGRFVEQPAARSWACGERAQGEIATVTYYSTTDGWRSHHVALLTDDGWTA